MNIYIKILYFIINLNYIYSFNIINNFNNLNYNLFENKNKVYVHLERFNEKYNLYHVGISFKNNIRCIRFDYRAFNDHSSYITNDIDRRDIKKMFPDLFKYDKNNNKIEDKIHYEDYTRLILGDNKNIFKKDIYLGETNKTIIDIFKYEEKIHFKYKLGIYDCRHYVNKLTKYTLNKQIPIWHLDDLWNEEIIN